MDNLVSRAGLLDRLAIGLSGLCVVHCIASAVLVALVASAGGLLVDHRIHETGLIIAIGLGIIALGTGIWRHGFMMPSAVGALGLGVMAGALTLSHNAGEVIYTILGVGILALGHDLNRRATL
ncbi:MerC domain-containing protein [Sphingomonas cavernae]|uniref:MerC domain-containing protein n=1 Tax=Sphingomonas cavernae TaxID=2320861 RepID=A0A418WL13_9SPHN|nr:MerC domain-containing protein [Sphingomonas cavernae]RJF90734.1 MerC domain-containing protein [Sphingomonas cavernae]